MKNVFFAFFLAFIAAFANASPASAQLMLKSSSALENELIQGKLEEGTCDQPGYQKFQLISLKERPDGKRDYRVRSKENTYQGVVDMHNARDSVARQLRGKSPGEIFCFNLE